MAKETTRQVFVWDKKLQKVVEKSERDRTDGEAFTGKNLNIIKSRTDPIEYDAI
jgi:hypothetical protein